MGRLQAEGTLRCLAQRVPLVLQRMKMPGPHERLPLHSRFQHLGQDALSFLEASFNSWSNNWCNNTGNDILTLFGDSARELRP